MFKFKKALLLVVLTVVAVVGTACKARTFKADGVYTAFLPEIHKDGPQVTSVSVTIKNDKIEKFFIDCVQNTKTVTEVKDKEGNVTETKVAFAFNEKSKKELGYEYGMHQPTSGVSAEEFKTAEGLEKYKKYLKDNNKLEWFEQAELIEKALVEKGVDGITKNDKNVIDNVTGVTVKDGNYTTLAKEAVELAKKGKTHVFLTSKTNIVWVTAEVDKKGKFTSLELNTLQGAVANDKFTWNAENKQQKGYKYGMHNPRSGGYDLNTDQGLADYKQYLKDNNKLEWFEQAKLITDFVLVNGVDALKVSEDKVSGVDALTKVSISAGDYQKVLTELYANFK